MPLTAQIRTRKTCLEGTKTPQKSHGIKCCQQDYRSGTMPTTSYIDCSVDTGTLCSSRKALDGFFLWTIGQEQKAVSVNEPYSYPKWNTLKGLGLNPDLDFDAIETQYLSSDPSFATIDNLLTGEALLKLRQKQLRGSDCLLGCQAKLRGILHFRWRIWKSHYCSGSSSTS
jgi:hypothetical protein